MAHFPPVSKELPMRKLAFVAVIAAGVASFLKRQRERELDEAIWEEPRDV